MARAKKTFTVKTGTQGLNLRAKPSIASQILRLIPDGEKVTINDEIEASDGWIAVKGGGYVMKKFLV